VVTFQQRHPVIMLIFVKPANFSVQLKTSSRVQTIINLNLSLLIH